MTLPRDTGQTKSTRDWNDLADWLDKVDGVLMGWDELRADLVASPVTVT